MNPGAGCIKESMGATLCPQVLFLNLAWNILEACIDSSRMPKKPCYSPWHSDHRIQKSDTPGRSSDRQSPTFRAEAAWTERKTGKGRCGRRRWSGRGGSEQWRTSHPHGTQERT